MYNFNSLFEIALVFTNSAQYPLKIFIREAISKYYSKNGVNYTPADVVLASGCSDALNLCIGVLANEGDNIILPSPGFALYETLCSSKGIQTRFYKLKPLVYS